MSSGQVLDHIVVRFRNVFEDKGMEGAVVGLPNVMHFGVEGGVWLRQGTFQPFGKPKMVRFDIEVETPLLPVGLGEVEMEIGGPGRVRHETFRDGDVMRGRRWDGIRTSRGIGIRTRGNASGPTRLPRGRRVRSSLRGGAKGCRHQTDGRGISRHLRAQKKCQRGQRERTQREQGQV